MVSLYDREENTVGKENAGYQHFLMFPWCFYQSRLFWRSDIEIQECVVKS